MIGLGHYLTVAAILFTLGVAGIILNRKNIIIILMSVELILLSVNINLVAFSSFLGDLTGQVFALFILTVAAAEAAIGLAILVTYYPQSRFHRGRRHQRDEGLSMITVIVVAAAARLPRRRPVRTPDRCARCGDRHHRFLMVSALLSWVVRPARAGVAAGDGRCARHLVHGRR